MGTRLKQRRALRRKVLYSLISPSYSLHTHLFLTIIPYQPENSCTKIIFHCPQGYSATYPSPWRIPLPIHPAMPTVTNNTDRILYHPQRRRIFNTILESLPINPSFYIYAKQPPQLHKPNHSAPHSSTHTYVWFYRQVLQ